MRPNVARHRDSLFAFALVGCTIVFLVTPNCLSANDHFRVDGDWWQKASKADRSAWVDGQMDCLVYDMGRAREVEGAPPALVSKKIDEYYRTNSGQLNRPAASVLMDEARKMHIKGAPGGERYPERHGVYTGEFLRQLVEPPAREAFILGYLGCFQTLENPKGSFSKPAKWYADQVAQWFGLQNDDESIIDDKRAGTPIADALLKFKDH